MRRSKPRVSAHTNLCMPLADIEALYWPLVDKRGPGECWAWLGPVHTTGLGVLHLRGTHGQTLTARRLAVLFSGESLPDAHVFVRGQCPNRLCVNPNHLQLGNAFAVSNEPPYLAFDDLRVRFHAKLGPQDKNGCSLWKGAINGGYGILQVADLDGKKHVLRANKVAVYLATRIWPARTAHVCHRCHIRACADIGHLYVGDAKTNGRDAAAHGSHRTALTLALKKANTERGCFETEARRKAFEAKRKLTPAQLRKIRKTYADNQLTYKGGKPSCGCRYTQAAIQAKLGCGENTVARAIARSVSEAKPETKKRNELIRKLYFGPHGHDRCRKLGVRSKRVTFKSLAKEYGVSLATIDYAIHGRRKPTMVAGKVAPKRQPHPPKRS